MTLNAVNPPGLVALLVLLAAYTARAVPIRYRESRTKAAPARDDDDEAARRAPPSDPHVKTLRDTATETGSAHGKLLGRSGELGAGLERLTCEERTADVTDTTEYVGFCLGGMTLTGCSVCIYKGDPDDSGTGDLSLTIDGERHVLRCTDKPFGSTGRCQHRHNWSVFGKIDPKDKMPTKKMFESTAKFGVRLDRWSQQKARKNFAWRKVLRQELRSEDDGSLFAPTWKGFRNTLKAHDDGMRRQMNRFG